MSASLRNYGNQTLLPALVIIIFCIICASCMWPKQAAKFWDQSFEQMFSFRLSYNSH